MSRLLRESRRASPKVSLILLDWSVRESFHLLYYLARQDVPRDAFEVVVVEYYSRVSEAIRKFEAEVDTWALLEMPEACYYHKHLMYNAGIVLARGEICVICDSDAMVKPTFIRSILEAFEREPQLVLHLDQFRNNRRDLYPFSYPSFEEVLGKGCINNAGGKPAGITAERIKEFNARASQNEQLVGRTIYAAGFTWSGVMYWDDIRTVDYLLTRPEVDPKRIG